MPKNLYLHLLCLAKLQKRHKKLVEKMLSYCDLPRSAVDFLRSSCCGADKYSYYKDINH